MTQINLTRFEASTLRMMSSVYAAISSDPDADCPVNYDGFDQAKEDERERQDIANVQSWMAAARTA